MTNKTKRVITAWVLGLATASFLLYSLINGTTPAEGIFIFVWAEFGLAYRAFETRDDFDSSPWLAYFFSYQIRIVVACTLLAGIVGLLTTAAKAPDLSLLISGPLAFMFGREPNLRDLFNILELRKK
jgi:hypothetical protein